MSKLFHTEHGRMFDTVNEELSRWRWVKKVLLLPAAAAGAPADLWMFVRMYDGNRAPLTVSLNGRKLARVEPDKHYATRWVWLRLPVPTGRLKRGRNTFVMHSTNPAMNGWMLGLENAHDRPQSYLSFDRGGTWQNRAMGAHGMLRGEYLVRLRVHSDTLRDPRPPRMIYEDTRHRRVRELRDLLPARIVNTKDPWKQVLALRTWVACQWSHDNKGRCYSPWDPQTVLDWVRRDTCHGKPGRIAFCVHFAIVFNSFAASLGHRSRGVNVTSDFNLPQGHFMSEVWDVEHRRWVLHDPNYDVHYEKAAPLSAFDLADLAHRRCKLHDMVRKGPAFPRGPKYLTDLFRDFVATGKSYWCTGLWSRNNFVSNPPAAPPNHGATSYCETEFVWYTPPGVKPRCGDAVTLAEPFPYRVSTRRYLDAPPPG